MSVLGESVNKLVYGNQRSVLMLESMGLIPKAVCYDEKLLPPQIGGTAFRDQWHKNTLKKLKDGNIVFLDPDNGLLPRSVSLGYRKSIKYIDEDEIVDYYSTGHSVVFYNHRSRQDEQSYLNRFRVFFSCESLCGAATLGIKYVRGTIRDYFFLVHPEHLEQVKSVIRYMLNSHWNQHFKGLQFN